mgnify:CR=1 FL=1
MAHGLASARADLQHIVAKADVVVVDGTRHVGLPTAHEGTPGKCGKAACDARPIIFAWSLFGDGMARFLCNAHYARWAGKRMAPSVQPYARTATFDVDADGVCHLR